MPDHDDTPRPETAGPDPAAPAAESSVAPSFSAQFRDAVQNAGIARVAPGEAPSGRALLGAVGGVRGLAESVLPGFAFLVVYACVQLSASLWFGERWFSRGDAFEVYSALLGRLSPLGRRDDGRLALRNPLRNTATLPEEHGLAAVAIVLVVSTGFDGLSRTTFWTQGPGAADDAPSGTLGLLSMIGLAAVLYAGAAAANGLLARQRPLAQPSRYAHSLLPIAAGYAIAHYFSLLLLDGQTTWILASNPFGRDGVDVFGTYGRAIDYTVISTATIALVQVGAVVLGHVLGVLLAHDRALQPDGTRQAHASDQAPLVAVMVGFTVGGLGLLLSA